MPDISASLPAPSILPVGIPFPAPDKGKAADAPFGNFLPPLPSTPGPPLPDDGYAPIVDSTGSPAPARKSKSAPIIPETCIPLLATPLDLSLILPPLTSSVQCVPATQGAEIPLMPAAATVNLLTPTETSPRPGFSDAPAASLNLGTIESRPPVNAPADIAAPALPRALHEQKPAALIAQAPPAQIVEYSESAAGTDVAKAAPVLNPNTFTADIKSSSSFRRNVTIGASVVHDRVGAPTMLDASVGAATSNLFAGDAPAAVDLPAPAGAAPVQMATVEALLQNAMGAGEKLRPDGQNKLELRVRLNGGNEDVTVNLQVANDRLHVTFKTDSPELRRALQEGWQQTSANASTLVVEQPRFANPRLLPDTFGGQSFSSGQQDSRRQDARTLFAGDDAGASAAPARSRSFTGTSKNVAAAGRWSGWA